MRKISGFLAMAAAVLLCETEALAGGYQLNEYSMTNLGRSFAGAGVVGDDYSAIAFNPAGMTLKKSGMQVGVTWVQLYSDAKGGLYNAATGTQINTGAPTGRIRLIPTLPHGFAQYNPNDKLSLGMGIYTPFGLATDYNDEWYGATHAIISQLDVLDIALGGAYKVTPQFSIGATVIARYVYGKLTNQVPLSPSLSPTGGIPGSESEMQLDGWDYAFNFGLMYEPIKDMRFGVAYRANNAHTVKGHLTWRNANVPGLMDLTGKWAAESTMTLPDQLTLSAFWKPQGINFGFSGQARWTKWEVFDTFIMDTKSPYAGTIRIPENWENSWTFALGVDYYLSPSWTLRTGVSYDQTPVPNTRYRTARIPDTDKYWISFGASYKYKAFTFDVGYAHLFNAKDKSLNISNGTQIEAEYRGHGNMFGFQMQYEF